MYVRTSIMYTVCNYVCFLVLFKNITIIIINSNSQRATKITYKHIFYINLMIFTYIIGAGIYYKLINTTQVSNITPLLSPLIIIFTLMIGYLYFKETLQKNELVGILIIVIGIYVIKSTVCKKMFN